MAFTDDTTGRIILAHSLPMDITLSGAVEPGDLIGYSSGWKQADGNGSIYAVMIAMQKGASGDIIKACREALIGGVDGATAGDLVYLSDTAGGYSASAGTVLQVVGQSLTATEFYAFPSYDEGGDLIAGAGKLFFRDSGIFIHSNADGKMTISADGTGTDAITIAGDVTMGTTSNMVATAGTAYVDLSNMTGTFKTPTGAMTIGGSPTVSGTLTLAVTTADKLTVGGVIVPQRVIVNQCLNGTQAATAGNYNTFFVADRAYEVVTVRERHSTAADGTDATVQIEKVPSGTANGTGTDILAAAIALNATANTNQSGTLSGTQANYQLAAGDGLGLVDTGTLTNLTDLVVTIALKPI